MEDLAATLRQGGIDPSSLRLLFQLHGDVVYALTVGGYDAFGTWEKLRDLLPRTGRWPMLTGGPDDRGPPTEHTAYNSRTQQEERVEYPDTPSILAQAEGIDGREFLQEKHRRHVEFVKDALKQAVAQGWDEDAASWRELLAQPEEFQGLEREDLPEDTAEPSSRWGIAAHITHDDDFNERDVLIALLPTPHSWQAPAVWKFGAFNACPYPHVHCAVLRYWERKYGAQVVAMTDDTIECLVQRPPRTRREALLLARDQYHYCSDIISQGEGSLDVLAAKLLDGEAWYFWWD